MPVEKLPITGIMYPAAEPTATAAGTLDLINAFVDPTGVLRKRPGTGGAVDISSVAGASKRVDGVHWWDQYLYVVAGDKLMYIDMSAASPSPVEVTFTSTVSLSAALSSGNGAADKVTWAHSLGIDGVERLFLCNGGKIIHCEKAVAASGRVIDSTDSDPGAAGGPVVTGHSALDSNVISIAAIDTYLLAVVKDTDKVYFSKVGDPTGGGYAGDGLNGGTAWSATDFFTAEYKPDNLKAVHTSGSYIYVFGEETTEVWRNDGINPFSPLKGSALDYGCLSGNTIKEIDGEIFWVNHRRQVMSHKRGDQIGLPVNKLLQYDTLVGDPTAASIARTRITSAGDTRITSGSDTRVTDEGSTQSNIHADVIRTFDRNIYLLHCEGMTYAPDDIDTRFMTTGFTLAYDINSGTWHRWANGDVTTTSAYEQFDYVCADYSRIFNATAMGRNNGSMVALASEEYLSDTSTASGTTIPLTPLWHSSWIDHGVLNKKRSRRLRVRMRVLGDLTGQDIIFIRYRDDGHNTWSSNKVLSLYTNPKAYRQKVEPTSSKAGSSRPIDVYSDLIYDTNLDLFRLGTYRTRQWQIWVTGKGLKLAIHSIEEEYEVLRT